HPDGTRPRKCLLHRREGFKVAHGTRRLLARWQIEYRSDSADAAEILTGFSDHHVEVLRWHHTPAPIRPPEQFGRDRAQRSVPRLIPALLPIIRSAMLDSGLDHAGACRQQPKHLAL